jgi:fumarate reductase subunit C
MLRESTCVLVAVYCVLVLAGLATLASSQAEQWNLFLANLQHPAWMAFHAFALVFFIVYQTMPWFRLAPRAMSLQWGQTEVPAKAIIAAHYLVWLVVSAVIFYLTGVF